MFVVTSIFWVKFYLKIFWSFSAWILVFPLTFIVESLHSWDALKHVSFIARWEVAAWELQEGERSLPNASFSIDAEITVRDTTLKNVVTNQMCWKVWTFVRRFFSLRRKFIGSKFPVNFDENLFTLKRIKWIICYCNSTK